MQKQWKNRSFFFLEKRQKMIHGQKKNCENIFQTKLEHLVYGKVMGTVSQSNAKQLFPIKV